MHFLGTNQIVDVFGIYFLSIDAGPQVAIILLACRPCVVIVNCLGQVLYLGRSPCTKETLPDFRECRVGYSTSTSVPRVDGLSTDTQILGCHKIHALGGFEPTKKLDVRTLHPSSYYYTYYI